jgi:hypothetical protein
MMCFYNPDSPNLELSRLAIGKWLAQHVFRWKVMRDLDEMQATALFISKSYRIKERAIL